MNISHALRNPQSRSVGAATEQVLNMRDAVQEPLRHIDAAADGGVHPFAFGVEGVCPQLAGQRSSQTDPLRTYNPPGS